MSWRSAIGTDVVLSKGKSSFVAMEALPAVDGGSPARAFLAGNIKDEFQFAGLPFIDAAKQRGVVVRVSEQGVDSWIGDWQSQAMADRDVFLNDLAISPLNGLIHVCGTSEKAVKLINPSGAVAITLQTNSDFRGFVAWLNPETGVWVGGFRTDGVEPVSLAIRADGAILVTGEGALAESYSASGALQWTAPETNKFKEAGQIATGTQPSDSFVYVLYEDDGSPIKEDVVISQLNAATGAIQWSKRMGGQSSDNPGGLAVGPGGEVVVSFSSKLKLGDSAPTYGGQTLAGDFEDDTEHSFLARLQPDGSTNWVKRLGEAQKPGTSTTPSEAGFEDLAIDPLGTIWVCGWGNGPWIFGTWEEEELNNDSLLLGIDATGKFLRRERTLGEAEDFARAVSAPAAGSILMVGDYKKGTCFLPSNQGVYGVESFPERGGSEGGYFAVLQSYTTEENPVADLRWRDAIGTEGTVLDGTSSFTAVETLPADESGHPAPVFGAGNIKGEFKFDGLHFVDANKQAGVVVRISDHGDDGWDGDWQAMAKADEAVTITDMALSPVDGLIHVCGTSNKPVGLFGATSVQTYTVPTNQDNPGFVARIHPETGVWIDGFRTDGIEPLSLAIRSDGSILVSGEGALAANYTTAGLLLWKAATPVKLEEWAHIATGEQASDSFVYVLFKDKDHPTDQDVVLSQLNASDGSVVWTKRMGSLDGGNQYPGGLAVAPDGAVVITYSVKNEVPSFNDTSLTMPDSNDATRAVIARILPDGSLEWISLLGVAQDDDTVLITQNIDIDPAGNAWVCGWGDGPWSFPVGGEITLNEQSVLFAVNPQGLVAKVNVGTGEASVSPHAVSAPSAGMVVIGGDYQSSAALTLYLPETEVSVIAGVFGTSGTPSLGKSSFSAVEALAADENHPARSFMAANIEDEFQFDGLPFVNIETKSAVVIRVSDHGGDRFEGDWQALAKTDGELFINDLAVSPVTGLIHVCGTSKTRVDLVNPSGTVTHTISGKDGFVASLNPETGAWLGGFRTGAALPVSLAFRADGTILVSGENVLAAKYSPTGQHLWTAPEPLNVDSWAHVATSEQAGDPYLYVLFEDKHSLTTEDVVLSQLNAASGSVNWSIRMGSRGNGRKPTDQLFKDGEETPGGLAVGPDGNVILTYAVKQWTPTFNGIYLPIMNTGAATRTVIAKVNPNGSPEWVRMLGQALDKNSKSLTEDLDIDPSGNAWVCGWGDGPWSFTEGEVSNLNEDTLLLAVDPTGRVVNFSQGLGEARDIPHAVSAPGADLVIIAGEYREGLAYLPFSGSILPARGGDIGAFFAILRPSLFEQLMVVRPNPNHPSKDVREFVEEMIELWGVSTYATVENGDDGTAVSVWMTDADIEAFSQDNWMIITPEVEFQSNGTVADPGWALARVGNIQAAAGAPYQYPDSAQQVKLYLIDSAISNPGAWFNGNPNVVLESSFLVRGYGDPIQSTAFDHGTQMLSVIAGPQTGAVQGTPIRVINYDVFPDGDTTTATLVAKGVVDAARHHSADSSGQPGVICLAISSEAGAISHTLRAAIDLALARGLTVIVSAGNLGGDVSQYIPACYGTTPGVICVGATDTANHRLAMSNSGSAVDLYAPGENVRAINLENPLSGNFDLMTGTSPAAALTAGAALIEVSRSPQLTPADIEYALKSKAAQADQPILQVNDATVTPPVAMAAFMSWASEHGITTEGTDAMMKAMKGDKDRDGMSNLFEYLHGRDPEKSEKSAEKIKRKADTGYLSLEFPISESLFDPANPQTLRDGTTWNIDYSCDLAEWDEAAGLVTWSNAADGVVMVTFETAPTTASCFLRIAVTPAP